MMNKVNVIVYQRVVEDKERQIASWVSACQMLAEASKSIPISNVFLFCEHSADMPVVSKGMPVTKFNDIDLPACLVRNLKKYDGSNWLYLSLDAMYKTGDANAAINMVLGAEGVESSKGWVYTPFIRTIDGVHAVKFPGILTIEDIKRAAITYLGSAIYVFGIKKTCAKSEDGNMIYAPNRLFGEIIYSGQSVYIPTFTHNEILTGQEYKKLCSDSIKVGTPTLAVVLSDEFGMSTGNDIAQLLSKFGATMTGTGCNITKIVTTINPEVPKYFNDESVAGRLVDSVHRFDKGTSVYNQIKALAETELLEKPSSFILFTTVQDLRALLSDKAEGDTLSTGADIVKMIAVEVKDNNFYYKKYAPATYLVPQRLVEAVDWNYDDLATSLAITARDRNILLDYEK